MTKPLRKADLEIDWDWPARRIVNAVRAFAPSPAARGRVRGVPVKILAAQTEPTPDAVAVQCGDGEVYLTRLVPPGKNAMSGTAFEQFLKTAAR